MRTSRSVTFLQPAGPTQELNDHPSLRSYKPLMLAAESLNHAYWSADERAVLVPRLWVAPWVVRSIAAGQTLFKCLSDSVLLSEDKLGARKDEHDAFSWVWGDLQVFETGEPVITDALFFRGAITLQTLAEAVKYWNEIRKSRDDAGL